MHYLTSQKKGQEVGFKEIESAEFRDGLESLTAGSTILASILVQLRTKQMQFQLHWITWKGVGGGWRDELFPLAAP